MMAGSAIEADLLCRACAAPHYGEKVDLQAVPALMEFYIWLSQSQFDSPDLLPKQICMQCYDRLDEFHRFQLMCSESNNLLLARFSKCIVSKGGESFEISFKDDTCNYQQDNLNCNLNQEKEKNSYISSHSKIDSTHNWDGEYTNTNDYDHELGGSYKYLQSDYDHASEVDIKPDIGSFNYSAFLEKEEEKNNPTEITSNYEKQSSTSQRSFGNHLYEGKAFLYKCNKCPRRFNVQERYEGHLRWHEGLKPFACKHCNKKYSRLERLRNHFLSDHSDSPRRFACTVEGCHKKYKNRETLKKHINQHSKRLHPCQEITLPGDELLTHQIFADSSFLLALARK